MGVTLGELLQGAGTQGRCGVEVRFAGELDAVQLGAC